MKYKIISSVLVLLTIFTLHTSTQTYAQIPFGGPVIASYECACSGGWFVLVYDLKTKLPIPMTFQFGLSMPRANYNFFTPGVRVVGSMTPGGICGVASSGCTIWFPTAGTITPPGLPGIGTSVI
jgi:hypothetical protein